MSCIFIKKRKIHEYPYCLIVIPFYCCKIHNLNCFIHVQVVSPIDESTFYSETDRLHKPFERWKTILQTPVHVLRYSVRCSACIVYIFLLRATSRSCTCIVCVVTLGRFAVISRLATRNRHSIRPAKTVVRNYRTVHALCVSLQTWRTIVTIVAL